MYDLLKSSFPLYLFLWPVCTALPRYHFSVGFLGGICIPLGGHVSTVQSYMKPFIFFFFFHPILFFYQFLSPLYFCWTFASLRFW